MSNNKPLPRNTRELTGDQALQILFWIEENMDYMEHGGRDPNGDADGRFWPHVKCAECAYAVGRMDYDHTGNPRHELVGCLVCADQFKGRTLTEYVLMRIEEGKQ